MPGNARNAQANYQISHTGGFSMRAQNRIKIVVGVTIAVSAIGFAAWAQQLEVKKDTWLATTAGNVGIGTTSPLHKLHVYTPGDGTAILESGTASSWNELFFRQGGLQRFSLVADPSGNFGVYNYRDGLG